MKITNLFHFTENHRFTVHRDFSLSGLDYKMLTSVYQPMVGAFAIGLYMTLVHQLPAERAGYSVPEQQRKLFLALELDPGEKGRKTLIEQTSRLEAVGLLTTLRRYFPDSGDYLYEYQLQRPLSPGEFFRNQHLTLLLRDKIGKYAVLFLRDELIAEPPEQLAETNAEDLTVPFYELFRLNTAVIDYELEQALYPPSAADRQPEAPADGKGGFDYASIIMRFPRGSLNRPYVEALKFRPDQLAAINYAAKKYQLTLQETCRLLDEDGLFDEEGTLDFELLQYKASLYFRQGKRRSEMMERTLHKLAAADEADAETPDAMPEKPVEMAFYLEVPPVFQGQCDIHQYNMMLRNEPYTLVLQRFFPHGSVPDGVLDIFEKIDLNYKLNEEVINVLIHFIHIDRRSWAKSSIEAVAADMLGKQVTTYEQAVEYVREKLKFKEQQAAGKKTRGAAAKTRSRAKPQIPIVTGEPQGTPLTAEELEAIKRKALKLEGK